MFIAAKSGQCPWILSFDDGSLAFFVDVREAVADHHVYVFNELAFQGAVFQMLTHGVSSAALFMLAGE